MAVNASGNYTKPTMRKNLFNKIKAGTSGGNAGQWSARKAQMLAKCNRSTVASCKAGHVYITVALAPVVVDAIVTASVAVE